jgi:hypothetical protein
MLSPSCMGRLSNVTGEADASEMAPNNSFKPNLLRYGNSMAEKACHVVPSTAQVGLIQALGPTAK